MGLSTFVVMSLIGLWRGAGASAVAGQDPSDLAHDHPNLSADHPTCVSTRTKAGTITCWSWMTCTGSGRKDRPHGTRWGCFAPRLVVAVVLNDVDGHVQQHLAHVLVRYLAEDLLGLARALDQTGSTQQSKVMADQRLRVRQLPRCRLPTWTFMQHKA